MKIVTIIGARPQFIKAASFSRIISGKHKEILVHTGQHFDANMSDVFFKELDIPTPQYNLEISGGTHGKMTGAMIAAIEEILVVEKPEWVLVYGDTNSTMAGALAAVKLGIPIAHVEAGGRLKTMKNPEEVNRVVTDHVSQLLFAVSDTELTNLRNEALGLKSYVVGNIMYDSYLYASEKLKTNPPIKLFDFWNQTIEIPGKYYYLTCHRQENTFNDKALSEIFKAMNQVDAPTIYPVHPRNKERAMRLCRDNKFPNIILIQPVGYIESVYLLKNCEKVVTDSGGLQCEAFYSKKQCITIFDYPVWPQTLVENRNQLSAPVSEEILEKLSKIQKIDPEYKPFGDGHTAEKIIEIMESYKGNRV